jgi:hypothetical protein
MQKGKKIIAIGERDGVPGPVIAQVSRRAGTISFPSHRCFKIRRRREN